MSLKSLDPGLCRDDNKAINQRFLNILFSAIFAPLREFFFLNEN